MLVPVRRNPGAWAFLIQKGKPQLRRNPNAWNKEANLLFLENNAGVGFSYYTNTTKDLDQFGDALAVHDMYKFLVGWFKRFPNYKGHEFYMAGQGYAGHQVPQLAEKILEMNKVGRHRINLKGVMIGNPALDKASDARGMIESAWYHAVISDEMYDNITRVCRNRADVQRALHASPAGNGGRWTVCNTQLSDNWHGSPASVLPVIRKLVDARLRVWVYSGDTDARKPPASTRYALRKLKLETVRPWRTWFAAGDDKVAGFTVVYKGLVYVTFRGAGFAVPEFAPVQARQLFSDFLAGRELPAVAATTKA